jgi:hypothetical protein
MQAALNAVPKPSRHRPTANGLLPCRNGRVRCAGGRLTWPGSENRGRGFSGVDRALRRAVHARLFPRRVTGDERPASSGMKSRNIWFDEHFVSPLPVSAEDDFKNDLAKAKDNRAELGNFLRLRLNIVARGEGKFIEMSAWNACDGWGDPAEDAPRYFGLDLLDRNDLTALVSIRGDLVSGLDVGCRFWLPRLTQCIAQRVSRRRRVRRTPGGFPFPFAGSCQPHKGLRLPGPVVHG